MESGVSCHDGCLHFVGSVRMLVESLSGLVCAGCLHHLTIVVHICHRADIGTLLLLVKNFG